MKRLMALIIMATMIMSTIGAISAVTDVYEICGSTNPNQSGNIADIANSGVVWTAIGATYPKANILSGTESKVTSDVKNKAANWIVLIGGSVANSLTKELVNSGKVTSDLNGYVKVKNAWGDGTASAMVIFGPNRDATKAACIKYAADIRADVAGALLN